MASLNKVMLIGFTGRDPEVRYTADGAAIANLSLATTETWKDKSGEKQERTEWHRVAMFGKLAEITGEYVKKGMQIFVEGRLQTRKWQDKDGQDKYTTEIVADTMKMLGSRGEKTSPSGSQAPAAAERQKAPTTAGAAAPTKGSSTKFDDFEDDIPF